MSAAENYCDYANSFSFTFFGICFLSTPHFNQDLYLESFKFPVPKNNFIPEYLAAKKQYGVF